MTQKGSMFKGKKKKDIPLNRHGKVPQTRKGKRNVNPLKFTKYMDVDRVCSFFFTFIFLLLFLLFSFKFPPFLSLLIVVNLYISFVYMNIQMPRTVAYLFRNWKIHRFFNWNKHLVTTIVAFLHAMKRSSM